MFVPQNLEIFVFAVDAFTKRNTQWYRLYDPAILNFMFRIQCMLLNTSRWLANANKESEQSTEMSEQVDSIASSATRRYKNVNVLIKTKVRHYSKGRHGYCFSRHTLRDFQHTRNRNYKHTSKHKSNLRVNLTEISKERLNLWAMKLF